jgi:hypothetical protein
VAHACNPSYSGGRDQEDRGSKPAQENSSRDYLETTLHKKGIVGWLKVKVLSSNHSTSEENLRPCAWWLTPVILVTQEGSEGSQFKASLIVGEILS